MTEVASEKIDIYQRRFDKNELSEVEGEQARISELKRFISKLLLSKNLNILIGSGCSRNAVKLMGETFENVKPNLEGSLGDFKDTKDIEGYLNWLISAINFNKGTGEGETFEKDFDTTVSALVESMPSREDYLASGNEYENAKKLYQAFYNGIFSIRDSSPVPLAPINIFTTNYDLFNEYALDEINVHYTLGFQGGIRKKFNPYMFKLRYVDAEDRFKEKWNPVRKFAKLYKLHGSTNWFYSEDGVYLSELQNEKLSNVMIYPSYVKHDVTNQSPYSELFREFTVNLQKPNSVLLVLGFGFPDAHINQLIEQALNNEDFIVVIFGDYDEEKVKNFYDKNKMKPNIHLIGGNYKDGEKGKLHYFNNLVDEFFHDDSLKSSEEGDGTDGE